ncbi:hypothetical protein K6U55_19360 [Vibrio diabolicus]|uniref:hypothetical protein n=1 Tax=Vibrio diabolicus TaxID=50719 RepID=UPI00211AD9BE|nr:hypothetical protein [Vibrio diabolicus]MCG6244179.1 hypothetical protein [Vibrio diabolicus]
MFHNIGDYYEKRYLTLLILLLASSTSLANVTPPDCDAEKTTKTVAKKTVVGIGSCCTPKETLKDTAIAPRKDKLPDEGVAWARAMLGAAAQEKKRGKR